jgi:hypothetical protein
VESFSNEKILKIRAEILAICGHEKYNTLVRQVSEVVERGKLRFWQQELFDNFIHQSSMSIEPIALYLQAFRGAVSVAVPEQPFVYPHAPEDALGFAIVRSDLAKIGECFRLKPDIVAYLASKKLPTWVMCEAGKHASPEAVRLLADLGCDLNQSDSNAFTGLGWAVANDRYDVAKTFLDLGADANQGSPLFNIFNNANPLAMAKLLMQYGADPNQWLSIGDHPVDLLSRSIERGQSQLADYFRSLGVEQWNQHAPPESESGSLRSKVVAYFEEHFGKRSDGFVTHIVSPLGNSPIAVNCIPCDLKSQRSILFTVGLSELTMDRVELMLGLPLDWPTLADSMKSDATAWPIQWMFRIARQLVENGGKRNQEWNVFSNESPPKPIADGVPFTAWALCGGKEPFAINRWEDQVRILEMYALHTEECELASRVGYLKLLERWTKLGIPEYIDVNRPNAGS